MQVAVVAEERKGTHRNEAGGSSRVEAGDSNRRSRVEAEGHTRKGAGDKGSGNVGPSRDPCPYPYPCPYRLLHGVGHQRHHLLLAFRHCDDRHH